jgi:hypothetical protein
MYFLVGVICTLEVELDDGYVSARVTWWDLEFHDEHWNGEKIFEVRG